MADDKTAGTTNEKSPSPAASPSGKKSPSPAAPEPSTGILPAEHWTQVSPGPTPIASVVRLSTYMAVVSGSCARR